MKARGRTTAPRWSAYAGRALGASTGLHVIGLAGVGALMAWASSRALGGEPQRVVTARHDQSVELPREAREPAWELEAPPAWELESAEAEPVLREAPLADEPLAFDDARGATAVPESVRELPWSELPRFDPPLEFESEPPPAAEPEPEALATGQPELEPVLLDAPPPAYPRLAQRRGWQGSVLCLLRVDAYGNVVEASLVTTSGHAVLDAAALEAVERWRFRPGQRNGRDDSFEVEHRVTFRLRG
ncbi:MAG: energy transducer TonB [Planctomycetota bacterium]